MKQINNEIKQLLILFLFGFGLVMLGIILSGYLKIAYLNYYDDNQFLQLLLLSYFIIVITGAILILFSLILLNKKNIEVN